MKIKFDAGPLEKIECRGLVVLAYKNGGIINGCPGLGEQLAPFVTSGEFGSKFGDSIYLTDPRGIKAQRLLVFNVGEKITKADDLRRATAKAWKTIREMGLADLLFSLEGFADEEQARAAFEGFILGDYQFIDFKTEAEKLPNRLKSLTVQGRPEFEAKVNRWFAICQGTCRARDLSQMPANVLTPTKFAHFAHEWSALGGYTVNVLEEADIEKEGMGAMLSVGQGSAEPSKFILMDYRPAKPSGRTIALVGKAVTFDSGGLSLKPSASMPEMKGDMGGGAAVLGIMSVLKTIGCPHRVVGLVPSVENMPSGSATRPSDVVKTLAGLTVEINNTDAEGRLILIDALTYADRYKPDYVVDFATLTGACLVALGPKVCAVMGNHQPLVDHILEAGRAVHEPFWQLPLVEEYNELLKSNTADISNISSVRWGGSITAGLFLQRFAEKYQWAHCDIAAAIFEKGDDYHPPGGTGIGVRMMVEVLNKL